MGFGPLPLLLLLWFTQALECPSPSFGIPFWLATELATGKETASAEPVTSTATFRIIRVFILHLPGIFEVSIRVVLSVDYGHRRTAGRCSSKPDETLRGLDAAVAVAGPTVVVGIVVPAVVLRDAVMVVVMVASVECRGGRHGTGGAEGENRDEQGES
jgi:hypothetical protein